jgi:hypothetical protein
MPGPITPVTRRLPSLGSPGTTYRCDSPPPLGSLVSIEYAGCVCVGRVIGPLSERAAIVTDLGTEWPVWCTGVVADHRIDLHGQRLDGPWDRYGGGV